MKATPWKQGHANGGNGDRFVFNGETAKPIDAGSAQRAALIVAAVNALAACRARDVAVSELVEAVHTYREADQEYGSNAYGSYANEQRLLRAKRDAADRVDTALRNLEAICVSSQ